MKKTFKLNRIYWMGLFLLIITIGFLPSGTPSQTNPPEIVDLPPLDDGPREGHPKMEYVLYQLMKTYINQGIEEARKFAELRGIDMEGDLVRVVAEARPYRMSRPQKKGDIMDLVIEQEFETSVNILSMQIEALGGKVETTYKQLVQNIIPVNSIIYLANAEHTKYIRLPIKPNPHNTSEGVAKTKADYWHSYLSYRSDGAKVCILDLGFDGYENLLGNELPSSVNIRSFRSDGDILANEVHGTACAEIVHDMAPNASLWLVNFQTSTEMLNAIDWIIGQGIDIISNSTGSMWGPCNGTGETCDAVKKATNNGIIWVVSAGNEADDHWEGIFNDPDKDGWHNFSGSDEILHFDLPAYTLVDTYLKWNDWGTWNGICYSGSNQDYDLYLYGKVGPNWVYIDNSSNWQTGWQPPVEIIKGWYSKTSERWGIAIRKKSSSKNVRFDLFVNAHKGNIEYNIPTRSLTSPADSPYAITVGATDWHDDSYHSYSSQGPTTDGRKKPDLSAPSGVSTISYGDPFYGTSAACPHVAGAFALLKSMTPQTQDQIKATLETLAIDLGPSGKDNKFGIGRLNLIK